MINTGYLFSNNSNRLFINTSLGCSANCTYCYLPILHYSKGKELNTYINAEELLLQFQNYRDFKLGKDGTLISFGCFSECWDEKNKPQTIKLIQYFLEKGNQIQLSTKKYIDTNDLIDIYKSIQYYGQLVIFVSSATISNWDKFEQGTTDPSKRFESFHIAKKLNIPVVLYIKPVLYNITIQDINQYMRLIQIYHIENVVVGSIIKTNGTGEVAPFVSDNSMRNNHIKQEQEIIEALSNNCKVYTRSTQCLQHFR